MASQLAAACYEALSSDPTSGDTDQGQRHWKSVMADRYFGQRLAPARSRVARRQAGSSPGKARNEVAPAPAPCIKQKSALVVRARKLSQLPEQDRIRELRAILTMIDEVTWVKDRPAPLAELIEQIDALPACAFAEFMAGAVPPMLRCIETLSGQKKLLLKTRLTTKLASAHVRLYEAMPAPDRTARMHAACEDIKRMLTVLALPTSQWAKLQTEVNIMESTRPLAEFHRLHRSTSQVKHDPGVSPHFTRLMAASGLARSTPS